MDIVGIELIANTKGKDRLSHYAEGVRLEQSESDKNREDKENGSI